MKKNQCLFLLGLFFMMSAVVSNAQQIFKDGHLQGTFRVKIKPDIELMMLKSASSDNPKVGIVEMDNAMTHIRATKLKRVFPYDKKHDAKHRKHGLHLWYEIAYSSSDELNNVVKVFNELSVIEKAERIREKSIHSHKVVPFNPNSNTPALKSANADYKFDDEYWEQYYHYAPTGI